MDAVLIVNLHPRRGSLSKGEASLLFVLEENVTSSPKAAHCKHNPERWVECGQHERTRNAEMSWSVVTATPNSLCFPFILLFLNSCISSWNIFLFYALDSISLAVTVGSSTSPGSTSLDSINLGPTRGNTAFYIRDGASVGSGIWGVLEAGSWIPTDKWTQWIFTFLLITLEILACIFNLV